MRLDEFYTPENDKVTARDANDNRKARLTLSELNKLRKYREIKKLEQIEHDKFARVMYSQPAQDNSSI